MAQGSPGRGVRSLLLRADGSWDTSARLLLHICTPAAAHLHVCCSVGSAAGAASSVRRWLWKRPAVTFNSEVSELTVLLAHVCFSLLITVLAFTEAVRTLWGQCSQQSWAFAFKKRHLAQTGSGAAGGFLTSLTLPAHQGCFQPFIAYWALFCTCRHVKHVFITLKCVNIATEFISLLFCC